MCEEVLRINECERTKVVRCNVITVVVACTLCGLYIDSVIVEVTDIHLNRLDSVRVRVSIAVRVKGARVDGGVDLDGGAYIG